MTVTENGTPDIPRDDQGRYRSARLPSLRGENVQLPPRINGLGQREAWRRRVNDPDSFITLDLFCGAGGMSLGFESAKIFVATGIDQEPMAIATHDYNFLSRGIAGDIREITDPKELLARLELPRIDVIVGGPPCQGFARIGKGKIRSIELEHYYEEVMNSLYKEFMRFVEVLQPLAFVMENVPDMARYQDGEILKRIKRDFSDYTIDWRVLNAVNYGVPQKRQRLFVQGNRINQKVHWPKVHATSRPVTVRDAIGDLPDRTPPSLDLIEIETILWQQTRVELITPGLMTNSMLSLQTILLCLLLNRVGNSIKNQIIDWHSCRRLIARRDLLSSSTRISLPYWRNSGYHGLLALQDFPE